MGLIDYSLTNRHCVRGCGLGVVEAMVCVYIYVVCVYIYVAAAGRCRIDRGAAALSLLDHGWQDGWAALERVASILSCRER